MPHTIIENFAEWGVQLQVFTLNSKDQGLQMKHLSSSILIAVHLQHYTSMYRWLDIL